MEKLKNNYLIKLICVVVLFLFITITFSACAQVRVMTITNEDNSIDELVSISLNQEEVVKGGYNLGLLKLDIESNSKLQANKMIDKLNLKISNDLKKVSDQESIKILNSFVDGISLVSSKWENNVYVVGVRFLNIDVYKYYYDIDDEVKTKTYLDEHFFYNKVYYYANTMYVKHNDLYAFMNSYYSVQYPTLIDSENNELLYTYKTEQRRQHSDADYITKQDGMYYHTWVVDKNNLDEPIMLYYNVANSGNWIFVSLCTSLGLTIVMLLIGISVSKLKHKKKHELTTKNENKQ